MNVSGERPSAKCPLCGSGSIVSLRHLPVDFIERHWHSIGYDVRSLPDGWPASIEKRLCLACDLRFYEPAALGGPDLYSALGCTPIYYGRAKWEFLEILRRFAQSPRGGAMLEYGCGRGWFLEQAARYFDTAVGIDFNEAAVQDCRARGLDVRVSDLGSLDGKFDVIVSFQVVEHLANPGGTLRQLDWLLKPGGTLIVAVPNEDSSLGELNYNYLNMPPHHASCWTRKTLAYVGEMLSLELRDYICEPVGLDLYLALLHERLDRQLTARSRLMKPWLWLIRRFAVAMAMVNFDSVRSTMSGHTHIALFRKPVANAAAETRTEP